jgi:hypothetical protein
VGQAAAESLWTLEVKRHTVAKALRGNPRRSATMSSNARANAESAIAVASRQSKIM